MAARLPLEAIQATVRVVRASLARDPAYEAEVDALDTVLRLLTGAAARGPSLRPRVPPPRLAVFERDHWLCSYCGATVTLETGHVDHVVPRSRGGSDDLANLAGNTADGPAVIAMDGGFDDLNAAGNAFNGGLVTKGVDA